jgi:hypothetical protein
MLKREDDKARRAIDNEEVTPDRLRDLLSEITYHWHGDQKAMRKAKTVLLKLIGELARSEVRKFERDKAREARKR